MVRTEVGVTMMPDLVTPMKFDVENSSTYEFVFASRYRQTGKPSFLAACDGCTSGA